jgi:ABC-type proline/glycine betaine transport system substrate-binding protein
MKFVDEYYGSGTYDNRTAVINEGENGYCVDLYLAEAHHKTIDVSIHSLSYAEDVAENWVIGIIKE